MRKLLLVFILLTGCTTQSLFPDRAQTPQDKISFAYVELTRVSNQVYEAWETGDITLDERKSTGKSLLEAYQALEMAERYLCINNKIPPCVVDGAGADANLMIALKLIITARSKTNE